jgi:hypothetical protein
VLDLSGLASEKARKARAAQRPIEWMDALLAEHDITLAIINSAEDPVVPASWVPIAELRTANEVNHPIFYARRAADVAAIAPTLARFATTLPRGVKLVEAPAPNPAIR